MHDVYLIQSDNINTQLLFLEVNLRVVSAIYPRDRPVLSCCTTSRSSMNSRPTRPRRDGFHLIRSAHLSKTLQRAAHQTEDVTRRFFETMAAITLLTIERVPDTLAHIDDLPLTMLVNATSDMMPTKNEKGEYFCESFHRVCESSSATNHRSAPTASSSSGSS